MKKLIKKKLYDMLKCTEKKWKKTQKELDEIAKFFEI